MKKLRLIGAIAYVCLLTTPTLVTAAPIYDTFGSFPDATWGGSGIPNDAVAASTQFYDGTTLIRIAMSATQRYSNPAPTNNGAGVYYAHTGSNFGGASESATEGALWNFNFFVEITDSTDPAVGIDDYDINLFYDFDPGTNTPKNQLGIIDLDAWSAAAQPAGSNLFEGSENLMFSWLSNPNYVIVPQIGSFDPNAIGEYHFGIEVAKDGWNVEAVAIDVQTVPVPAAVWLFGSGLLGLVGIARRKKT